MAQHTPGRCEICDWPLADSRENGCVPGDCSYRTEDPAERQRLDARRRAVNERRTIAARFALPTAEDALQADLAELLVILGMGHHARPQSPHEVFQEALGVLRVRLAKHAAETKARDAQPLEPTPNPEGRDSGRNVDGPA